MRAMTAATRLTTDSAASESRPTDPVSRYAPAFSAMVTTAAAIDSHAYGSRPATECSGSAPTCGNAIFFMAPRPSSWHPRPSVPPPCTREQATSARRPQRSHGRSSAGRCRGVPVDAEHLQPWYGGQTETRRAFSREPDRRFAEGAGRMAEAITAAEARTQQPHLAVVRVQAEQELARAQALARRFDSTSAQTPSSEQRSARPWVTHPPNRTG